MKIEIEITKPGDRDAEGTWSVSHECYQHAAAEVAAHVICAEIGADLRDVNVEMFGAAGLAVGDNETSGTWLAAW